MTAVKMQICREQVYGCAAACLCSKGVVSCLLEIFEIFRMEGRMDGRLSLIHI